MWSALLLLLSLLLLPVQQAIALEAAVLDAHTARMDLSGKMDKLTDSSGQLSIAQVVASPDFTPLPGELNLGFTTSTVWLRVAVARKPAAAQTWLLEITNPFHDDVRLYTQAADGSLTERHAGDRQPRQR